MVRGHFRRLEELRSALFSLGHQDVRVVPTLGFGPSDVELIRFKGALQDLAATFRDLSDRPDERLAAVLAAVSALERTEDR